MTRGPFLCLPIAGEGTAEVEALSSYIVRLAHLHAVAPGSLVRIMLDRLQPLPFELEPRAFRVPIAAFIRPNDTTEAMVNALAASTGLPAENLECLTFLATKEALHRPQGAFSPNFRWCPACMGEQRDAGQPVYFKLSWQLTMVASCDIHGVRLRDTCSACGAKQTSERARDRLDLCHRCAAPLFRAPRFSELSPQRNGQLLDLIEHIATHPGLRFPQGGVSRVVNAIFDEAWRGHEEENLYRLIPRDECVRFANADEPITIQAALRIAFRLRIPVVALLEGELSGTNRPLLPVSGEPLPETIAPRKRGARARIGQVATVVAGAMQEAESGSTVSLKSVARGAGVSVGYLRYRFPAWVDQIASSNRTAHRLEQAQISGRIRATVDTIEADLTGQSGGVLSRKAALRQLVTGSGLPKHRIRAEINARVVASVPHDRRKH